MPPGEIVSLPVCTQRRIRRGAAPASRVDPLAFSGYKRGHCFFAVLNGTAIADPEPVRFSCDPENCACGQATSESTAKDTISARVSFTARAAFVPLLDWLHACVAHECRNPEDPDALGDDSTFFAVTQQQLCSQNATLHIGLCTATLFPVIPDHVCCCEGRKS